MRKKLNIGENFIAKISNTWQSGDLIVISSRPKMGKTRFLLSLIQNETFKQNNFEFISINYDVIANSCPNNRNVNTSLTDLQIECSSLPLKSIDDVKNYILSKNTDIKFVLIDNIELINENISNTLTQLKELAKERSIVVITSVPLDAPREKERFNPSLKALKSKIPAIMRLADFIYFIKACSCYLLPPVKALPGHIIIAKNKDRETGYFRMQLNISSYLFEDSEF